MGQVPLDLPDPLQVDPSASSGGADELLSQIAGEEIDRLLAEAEAANDADTAAQIANESRVTAKAAAETARAERRETAVSSFVSRGDPALEAELDNLLENIDAAAAAPGESEVNAPSQEKETLEPPEGSNPAKPETGETKPAAANSAPALTDSTGSGSTGSAQAGQSSPQASPSSARAGPSSPRAAPSSAQAGPSQAPPASPGTADSVLAGELDQLFEKMTAAAEPAPSAAAATPAAPAVAKPAGSIDLLKVLDPIVAKDAAAAQAAEAPPAKAPPDDEHEEHEDHEEQEAADAGPVPIFVRVLEWANAPLAWLSPEVRDAAGKVGILTLINALAVLLYVLFFRKK